jgi:hypothetical protein
MPNGTLELDQGRHGRIVFRVKCDGIETGRAKMMLLFSGQASGVLVVEFLQENTEDRLFLSARPDGIVGSKLCVGARIITKEGK